MKTNKSGRKATWADPKTGATLLTRGKAFELPVARFAELSAKIYLLLGKENPYPPGREKLRRMAGKNN